MTNDGNAYLHGGKLYGRVNSDETICKQVKRLKELRDIKGIDSQYYVTCRNTVKVKWSGLFRDFEFMAKHFKDYQLDKEINRG